MTTPIDLDLVELRCKLRGWRFTRYDEDPSDPEPFVPHVDCLTDDGLVTVYIDGQVHGPSVEIKQAADGRRSFGLRTLFVHGAIQVLTAPRWTLDRLLSEPPEGWEYEARHERLMWQGDDGDSLCLSVSWCHDVDGWLEWDFNLATERHHHDLAAFAGQLKAAAELALILAEVEP